MLSRDYQYHPENHNIDHWREMTVKVQRVMMKSKLTCAKLEQEEIQALIDHTYVLEQKRQRYLKKILKK